jgi:bifunctional DNA-binding transcriptional regulator/antitoxin component of YhaV-PrlF toxin-antitoxin module
MTQSFEIGDERRQVSRVVRVGSGLYCLLPAKIAADAGWKRGDRLVMETDGNMVYAVKIPIDELLARKRHPNGGTVRVQARPDGYVKGGK